MEKYVALIYENKIVLQESEYIEDGFYIEIVGSKITLYEIPEFGGNPCNIRDFETIIEAINFSKTLT